MKKEDMIVRDNREIAQDIYEMVLEGNLVGEVEHPGEFLHINTSRHSVPLLRRPISICSTDKQKSQLTILYRAEGQGTRLLSTYRTNETVDVLGPLGNGFPVGDVSPGETVLLVGGGIGVPPLYDLATVLRRKGATVITVLGFSNKNVVFYENHFQKLGDVYVSTIDGSFGYDGFVTDVIDQKKLSFDRLFACGPVPMLRALEDKYPNVKGSLSLEERMGCGIGVCLACVCHTQNDPDGSDYRKVCSDGPVFPWGEVVL
ncbi:dihydroorotate dehydrogenase electron transfer subunit [Salibacterium salarium]|uniref:Dihydroorotate dehydrogenase B (NAD(+)), electron transfer subunit n=1 Tax=Salibacterium salarium TaxID=284579 RepID=A0A428MZA8_9BACI|nr:dihydroorotate dehydrogenase electron transfer subunit [Salibacterium salarium]RSL31369.1 dihydroorotate dehydrogenase electron transfer subunit [Salibacterium salarium]